LTARAARDRFVQHRDAAGLAHADLLELPVAFVHYTPLAERVWEPRTRLTAYDACCVALAELLKAPLARLDGRLVRATGPRCDFLMPPG